MKIGTDRPTAQPDRQLAPAYLLHGDEPLQLAEIADEVRARARKAGYENRELMFAERGFDWDTLHASSASLSLFSQKRILEVRLPTGKPGKPGGAALQAYLENPPEDTVLLVVSARVDTGRRAPKWVKAFEKKGRVLGVKPIPVEKLPAWIMERMQRAGLQCPLDAAELLAERVEGNLLAAAQEIEKLRLSNGPGKVYRDTVMRSVADSARFDVFTLVDAVLVGEAGRAVRIMEGLRSEGVAPPLVLWGLSSALHDLARTAWLVRSGVPAGKAVAAARVWFSRRSLVQGALRRHSLAVLHRLLESVVEIDMAIKGQAAGEPWSMMHDLACRIAGDPLHPEAVAWKRAG